jgi:hypothetical protein
LRAQIANLEIRVNTYRDARDNALRRIEEMEEDDAAQKKLQQQKGKKKKNK